MLNVGYNPAGLGSQFVMTAHVEMYFDILVVPKSMPQTVLKSMNQLICYCATFYNNGESIESRQKPSLFTY